MIDTLLSTQQIIIVCFMVLLFALGFGAGIKTASILPY